MHANVGTASASVGFLANKPCTYPHRQCPRSLSKVFARKSGHPAIAVRAESIDNVLCHTRSRFELRILVYLHVGEVLITPGTDSRISGLGRLGVDDSRHVKAEMHAEDASHLSAPISSTDFSIGSSHHALGFSNLHVTRLTFISRPSCYPITH